MNDTKTVSAIRDLQIRGGKLVKPFDANCKDQYVQCVADEGAVSVWVSIFSDENAEIFVEEERKRSGEAIEIKLKENGYGYVTKTVKVVGTSQVAQTVFVLAILKPAPTKDVLYGLENRPRFHYSAPYGYINDPNGMIYDASKGKYHLFYQAYPYAQKAAHKHWGHATTEDLVTFEEQPTALYPDDNGSMWSGTAIVDYENTAKLYDENTPKEARILLVYYAWKETGTGAGLAYTPDGGKTWIKADNGRLFHFIGRNPGHVDPKVFWSEKFQKWIMFCASGNIYTSVDLWNWFYNSFDKAWECPDVYEMTVEETGERKFVRSYGGSLYAVGDIVEENGLIGFRAETEAIRYNGDSLDRSVSEEILRQFGWFSGKTGSFYAAQHYAEAPNGKIFSIGWMIERGLDVSGTFAGAMSIATELTLHKTSDETYRLYHYPVEAIKSLRGDLLFSCSDVTVTPNGDLLKGVGALYADISGRFCLDEGVTKIGFRLRTGADGGDITIEYDVCKQALIADYSNSKHEAYNGVRTIGMKKTLDGRISFRILLDNIIIESFANDGEAYISSVFSRDNACRGMELFVVGGRAVVENLEIYEMKSAWTKR